MILQQLSRLSVQIFCLKFFLETPFPVSIRFMFLGVRLSSSANFRRAEEAFTSIVRAEILARAGAIETSDLGGFESHILAVTKDGQDAILRAAHLTHRTLDQVAGELEWLRFLQEAGAPVCEVMQIDGHDCVAVDEFVVSLLVKAPGKIVEQADWQAPFFERWGEAIGHCHELSRQYQPMGKPRFHWDEDDNINFPLRIPKEQEAVLAVGAEEFEWLKKLPQNTEVYGLIHCDAHPGNFFVDDQGSLTLFDFDDCCYQWYAYDVATVIFSAVLQPWIGDTQGDRIAEAQRFIPAFLSGYARQSPMSALMLSDLHHFLKVRELSLFGVFHTFMDVNNIDDWYGNKFMANRQKLIEAREPFLDIDFSQYG